MYYIMVESAFRELLSENSITDITVEEAFPSKGKPAKKRVGGNASNTVWIVKIRLGEDKVFLLESARGGAREWASLDNLNKWLTSHGVPKYLVSISSPANPLQYDLELL